MALTAELSLPLVLQRIVDLAVALTDATYGALGVLGAERRIDQRSWRSTMTHAGSTPRRPVSGAGWPTYANALTGSGG